MGWVAYTANSHLFQFLRLQVPRARVRLILYPVRTPSWFIDGCCLAVSSMLEGARELSGSLYKDTNPLHESFVPRT